MYTHIGSKDGCIKLDSDANPGYCVFSIGVKAFILELISCWKFNLQIILALQ